MSSTECPGCGQDCASEKGMKIHYGRLDDEDHPGSLAYETVECEGCGTEITDKIKENRKYCKECFHNAEHVSDEAMEVMNASKTGEDHPMYGTEGVWKGVTGEDHPCYGYEHTEEEKRNMSKRRSGENHPNYGKEWSDEVKAKISETQKGKTLTDEHKENISESVPSGEDHHMYGKEMPEERKKKLSDANSGEDGPMYGKNHTEETRSTLSNAQMGENNPQYGNTGEDCPNWKGGLSKKFSDAFYKNREDVIQRDNEECRVCSMSREEHREWCSKDLTAHHITPRDNFIDESGEKPPDEAGAMNNLFTVCKGCHRGVENGNISIPENGNQMSGMDW